MNAELPRGMRDLDSDTLEGINYVREKFFESAHVFNFTTMEPSPIETLQTLETKSGPSISEEIYSMTDKGGRNIGLRFDLTVGLTRFVTRRRDLKMPLKIASFGGVWRYDEPQSGRYRYFHQCDLEIYGSQKLTSDAEIIEFMYSFLRKLGLDVTIEINNRLLVEEFVRKKLNISDAALVCEVFRIMDKVTKKGSQAILKEYGNKIDGSILEKLIAFSSIRAVNPDSIDNIQVLRLENWRTMTELMEMLESRGIRNAAINLGIVRGLDYYSGVVFEAYDTKANLGALVGGGRYDRLTELFGRKNLGATGAAAGVERILLALRQRNLIQKSHSHVVYVAFAPDIIKTKVMQLVSALRSNGFVIEYDLQDRTLTKQLEDASSKNTSVAIILAPKELERGEIIIKSLRTGKERKLQMEKLVEELRLEISNGLDN
ncbi:MAG TPA: histidine--tRNA ligase [Nitrososphaeraceae archaeon]|nr:histidine--tRNA ligase [Nitrososphaeraceae archaeon]